MSVKSNANSSEAKSSNSKSGKRYFTRAYKDWNAPLLRMVRGNTYKLVMWFVAHVRTDYANNGKELWGHYDDLREELNLSNGAISSAFKEAVDKGLMVKEGEYWRLTFLPTVDEHGRVVPPTMDLRPLAPQIGAQRRTRKEGQLAPESRASVLHFVEPYRDGQETRCSRRGRVPPSANAEGGPPTANAAGVPDEFLDSAMPRDSEPTGKSAPNHCDGNEPLSPHIGPAPLSPCEGAGGGDGASAWDEEIAELEQRKAIWRASRQQGENPVDAVSNAPPLVPNGLCTKCGGRGGELYDYGGAVLHSTCVAAYEADERERNNAGGDEPLDF